MNQIKIGALLSYIEMFTHMAVTFLFTPLMLRILGQSEYGLYSTAVSTISALSILSLGFSSSYIKLYAKYRESNDSLAVGKLNGLYLIIFSVIGLVALVCGLIISLNLEVVYGTGLTAAELDKAKILMLLLTFNLATNFPLSIFGSIINAHEKFIWLKLVHMIKHLGGPLVMIPVLLLGGNSVGLVLSTIICTLLSDLLNLYYCVKKIKVKFVFKDFEKGLFSNLFSYSVFIALYIIIDQINWNLDKVIIGRYRGTSSVAIYSVGHTIQSCYMAFSQNLTNVFIPRVHLIANKYACDIKKCASEFSELFIRIGRIQYMILMLVALGFVFYGAKFINIWAGDGYINSYYVVLLMMLPSTICFVQTLGIEIQRSLSKHKFRTYFSMVVAILNIIFSIIFCKIWGEVGCALGTGLALVITDGIAMNIYYSRVLHISIPFFWANIFKVSMGLLPPVIYGVFCKTYWAVDSISIYLLQIGIFTFLYLVSIYYLSMNAYEKELTCGFVNKIFKKKTR